ncbi:hypothetical protein SH528x_005636 [Novipirellula sp. SH528]|uniref:hypothetical protein n=1 Tax=Novipirellula sp. SH528 TaxID=3454466 RepID=UPI003F9F4536
MPSRASLFLFNLSDDISETTNVASNHPELVKRLHAQWREWDKASKPPLWSRSSKGEYQFADYEWLKGSPHYHAKEE